MPVEPIPYNSVLSQLQQILPPASPGLGGEMAQAANTAHTQQETNSSLQQGVLADAAANRDQQRLVEARDQQATNNALRSVLLPLEMQKAQTQNALTSNELNAASVHLDQIKQGATDQASARQGAQDGAQAAQDNLDDPAPPDTSKGAAYIAAYNSGIAQAKAARVSTAVGGAEQNVTLGLGNEYKDAVETQGYTGSASDYLSDPTAQSTYRKQRQMGLLGTIQGDVDLSSVPKTDANGQPTGKTYADDWAAIQKEPLNHVNGDPNRELTPAAVTQLQSLAEQAKTARTQAFDLKKIDTTYDGKVKVQGAKDDAAMDRTKFRADNSQTLQQASLAFQQIKLDAMKDKNVANRQAKMSEGKAKIEEGIYTAALAYLGKDPTNTGKPFSEVQAMARKMASSEALDIATDPSGGAAPGSPALPDSPGGLPGDGVSMIPNAIPAIKKYTQ